MLVAARRLSLVAVLGLLIAVAFFTVGTGSRARRLQELQLRGSRAWAQRLRCMDLVAPRHVESSPKPGNEPVSPALADLVSAGCVTASLVSIHWIPVAPQV